MKNLRITFNSPVVLSFVGICFIATLAGVLTGGVSTQLLFLTWHSSLRSPLTYLRFFTHVFGHAGWDHFMSNAIYLLLLGPMLEEKYGSEKIIKVIAITALATGLVNYICFPEVGLCGASGIVFAFIILTSFTGFRGGEIPLTFILIAVIFIGQQVLEGIAIQDNISNIAHIVGGVIGSVIGYKWNRKGKIRPVG